MNKTFKIVTAVTLIALSGYGVGRAQGPSVTTFGEVTRAYYGSGIADLAYSQSGQFLAVGGEVKKIIVWDTHTGEKVREYGPFKRNIAKIAWSPNGQLIVAASLDDTLKIFDFSTGQILHEVSTAGAKPLWMVFSPDGKSVTYAGTDGKLVILPVSSKTE